MSQPRIIALTRNISAQATYDGMLSDWSPLRINAGDAVDLQLDARLKTLVYEDVLTGDLKELNTEDFSSTGFSMSGVVDPVSVQIDYLTGTIYALGMSSFAAETGQNYWGGSLYRQRKDETSTSSISIVMSGSKVNLFRPQDMKLDPARKKIWIADTGNHRLLSIDIGSYNVLASFEFKDLVFCHGISVNNSTGVVASRWFDADSLEERIVLIDNDEAVASYSSFSDFPWGSLSAEYGSGDLLVVDSKGRNAGVYRISASGIKTKEVTSHPKVPIAISEEPIYGTVAVLHADGTISSYSNEMKYIGDIKQQPDPSRLFSPCMYGICHLSGNYKSSSKTHSPALFRVVPGSAYTVSKTISFQGVVAAVNAFRDMRTTLLTRLGKTMVTISKNGESIDLSSSFDDYPRNLISQDISNGDLIIGRTGEAKIERYTSEHVKVSELLLSSPVISIESKHAGNGSAWVVLENKIITGVMLSETSQVITSMVAIDDLKEIRSVKHDFVTGGAWANSNTAIYKISSDGLSVLFEKSGFGDVISIAPQNYLSDLYDGRNVHMPLSKSMSFDAIRNQLWWLSSPSQRLVGTINLNNKSGATIKIQDTVQYIESSSSYGLSSSSSEQSS
jgi:hypothetical protein